MFTKAVQGKEQLVKILAKVLRESRVTVWKWIRRYGLDAGAGRM